MTYEQLNEQVRSREASLTTVLSFLLPASLVLATLSFDPNIRDNAKRIIPILGLAALPGGAALVAILALLYWITGEQVDNVFWDQIHLIEKELGITEGQTKIHELLDKKRLYHIRRILFPGILTLTLISYAWLFYLSLGG